MPQRESTVVAPLLSGIIFRQWRLDSQGAAEHFGIDDVIDPRDTRSLIAATFARCMPRKTSRGWPDKRHGISPI